MKENPSPKVCLAIGGLDPSGGAGIIADVKAFSAFGCFATAAITSITFQNTSGVFGAQHQTAEAVRSQITPIMDDFSVSAVKTGMLPTSSIINEIAEIAGECEFTNLVVDPVIRATSGYDLISDAALKTMIAKLFPLAKLVTPNIIEAERITGKRIKDFADIESAAHAIRKMGARNILIKGGHFAPSVGQGKASDFLLFGDETKIFEAEFLGKTEVHGTGCVLASAIAANLALGNGLIDAIATSKKFVSQSIENSKQIGKGNAPIQIKF